MIRHCYLMCHTEFTLFELCYKKMGRRGVLIKHHRERERLRERARERREERGLEGEESWK